MQMFGVGLPELMVILILAVLVIGPDRLPAFAADLARWIRQARAYATHLTKDFNDVVGELEKEAGASREDWKEIASVVGLHTQTLRDEVKKVADQIEVIGSEVESTNGAASGTPTAPAPASNVVPFESPARTVEPPPLRPASVPGSSPDTSASANGTPADGAEPAPTLPEPDGDAEYERVMGTGEDKPWYETDRPSRRTRRRTSE
jgi:sec-independent protein translocase protein TatB